MHLWTFEVLFRCDFCVYWVLARRYNCNTPFGYCGVVSVVVACLSVCPLHECTVTEWLKFSLTSSLSASIYCLMTKFKGISLIRGLKSEWGCMSQDATIVRVL